MALLMKTLRDSPAALRRRFTRDRTESLSHGDPLFKVHYLGTEKIYSLQAEQAEEAIGRLLQGAPAGKLPKDHALVVRPRYVEVKEIATGRQLTKTYLRDIACCAAGATRPDVFLYICKSRGSGQLQCRVFWCSKEERVRQLTGCLAQSFQRALSDWQESSANQGEESEGMEGAGPPRGTPCPEGRASTLPANLDRGRWRKQACNARTPLKARVKRGSAGGSWEHHTWDTGATGHELHAQQTDGRTGLCFGRCWSESALRQETVRQTFTGRCVAVARGQKHAKRTAFRCGFLKRDVASWRVLGVCSSAA